MKLLSLLVCLAMMLSGGYMNDDPNAAASMQVTVRDLVVEIQGEEYPLNPTATFSASTENGSALLDFHVDLNDQTLFPAQAKLDETGAGVLLGASTTAYTFSPEFFDSVLEGAEIPDEAFAMIDSYFNLLRTALNLDASAGAEINLAVTEKFFELIGEVETTEATFTANGAEQTGQRFAFELDGDAVIELMDYNYSLLPEDFTAAYYGYLNTALALTGSPEITSFAGLMDNSGMEMSVSGELTANETCGAGEIVMHITVDETASYLNAGFTEEEIAEMGIEPITMDVPMDITVHSAEHVECEAFFEQDDMQMSVLSTVNGGEQNVSMVLSASDAMSMTFDIGMFREEDGVSQVRTGLSVYAGGTAVALSTDTAANDAGSSTDVFLSYSDESLDAAASFCVDVTHDAITDRISAAAPQMITSADELEGTASTGLSLAAMSMMGDVETLLNNESVAALVPAVEQLLSYGETEADMAEETTAIADPPADFPEPIIGSLPEGFELYDSYYDGEYGCYSFVYSATDDSGSEIYIDVYDESGEDPYTYFSVSDGAVTPVSGSVIATYAIDESGFASAYGTVNGHYIDVYIYGSYALTVEDAANIAAGISFAG